MNLRTISNLAGRRASAALRTFSSKAGGDAGKAAGGKASSGGKVGGDAGGKQPVGGAAVASSGDKKGAPAAAGAAKGKAAPASPAVAKPKAVSSTPAFDGNVKVGDVVPVKYIKDEKDITIKEDSEYPEWLFSVALRRPSIAEISARIEKDSVNSLGPKDMRRLRGLLLREKIREGNNVYFC
jgi:hypothetical protein